METWAGELESNKDKTVVFICRSGNRSATATRYFRDRHMTNVYNMTGGMREWNRLGYPIATDSEVGTPQK